MNSISRRTFVKAAGVLAAGVACPSCSIRQSSSAGSGKPPSYLAKYAEDYARDPRAAARRWFREARFGLFLHYGLYSIPARHEWIQFREKIPVAEYARLKDQFASGKFDADFITDLAAAAGMKYVNITTRHHDSFSLFETRQNDFHSVNSPAQRDLIGLLADACRTKALGLCLYYSHGRDWRHPHAPNNDRWGGNARPQYDPPEPSYAYGREHDLRKYVEFMTAQVTELLSNYGPIAAIWLDGIGVPLNDKTRKPCPRNPSQPDNAPEFRCQELYDLVHHLQPQTLVSYKQGLLGTEDFFAPEHKAIHNPTGKLMEVCTTLQKGSWGYHKDAASMSVDDAMKAWENARLAGANLLLNTGPLPDGSILPAHAAILKEMGRRLRTG